MLARTTLVVFTVLLFGATLTGFAQIAAQTTKASANTNNPSDTPKPKLPARVVFDIPDETVDATDGPNIKRLSIYDPTPEQIRDMALLDAIKADVIKGHAARDADDNAAALGHYQSALRSLEDTMLDINSYDLRFGIAMVAPAIAETYAALNDARAKPATQLIDRWAKCGLMATAEPSKAHFDPNTCSDILAFDLFRNTGD